MQNTYQLLVASFVYDAPPPQFEMLSLDIITILHVPRNQSRLLEAVAGNLEWDRDLVLVVGCKCGTVMDTLVGHAEVGVPGLKRARSHILLTSSRIEIAPEPGGNQYQTCSAPAGKNFEPDKNRGSSLGTQVIPTSRF
jgi:hypothetical protein